MRSCGEESNGSKSWFSRAAHNTACWTGKPGGFISASAIVLIWAITGPIFGFSDTWQLVINTGTTIVTFLMVFLIQNSQNRDTVALHLKLDEVLRSIADARDNFMDIEDLEESELEEIRDEYRRLAAKAREMRDDRPQRPSRPGAVQATP
jgi:low affinity Fe/Cu permease